MAQSKADASVARRRTLAQQGKAILDEEAGGRFPITNRDDLRRAIRAVGRANPGERARVRRYITRRARALGLTHMIPDSWQSDS